MIYIYNNNNIVSMYPDDATNESANHDNEKLLGKYTEEEYALLAQPIRIIDGKLFFGQTDEEKLEEENRKKEEEARWYLNATDYTVIKISEGEATIDEYKEILKKRKEARETIRSLEKKEK